MPNTLAHLGLQAIVTRTLIKDADLKWIALGAIVPDIPWILQRLVLAGPLAPAAYDVRLYAIVQSSLVFSLVLSAALAVFARHPGRTFAILALGATLHLLLDALETKWGNGVLFLAPFSWQLIGFRLFWPEGLITTLLSLIGLLSMGYAWQRLPVAPLVLAAPPLRQALFAGALLCLYLLLPLPLMAAAEAADNHFVGTLRDADARVGRKIEIDRPFFQRHPAGNTLRIFTGEHLHVQGLEPPSSGTVSIKGRFVAPDTLEIVAYHAHPTGLRDAASYLGLAMVLAVWSRALLAGTGLRIARLPEGR